MWKDKPVQKATEGTRLAHAKIPLQKKSLWVSSHNTVFLSSWTGFLSPAKLPLSTHADPRAGTELHLGPGLDQPWGCLLAGTAGMNPNFCIDQSSKLLGILVNEIQSSPRTYMSGVKLGLTPALGKSQRRLRWPM